MKMKIMIIVLVSLLANLFSCSSSPTQPSGNYGTIVISFEGTSSTEAWINLKTQNISFPAEINLLLDSKKLTNINLTSNDTTIYIDSLLPNKTYNIQANTPQGGGQSSNQPEIASNKLSVTTLDTTSHNFTWQTYTFGGQAGSCVLRDVAIINQDDIWAVGEIYMNDSTGKPDPQPYNVVHWDGNKWNLVKAPFYYQGKAFYSPLYSVYAFNANDIWLEAGIHWDGNQFQTEPLNIDFPSHVNKIWGTSSSNLYIVGNNGLIAHRNSNGLWSKIQSGTTLNIQDIWGGVNPYTGDTEIFCVASNVTSNDGIKILKINNGIISSVNTNGLPLSVKSIWFSPRLKYFIAGDGLFTSISLYGIWSEDTEPAAYYKDEIRGSAINDIILCGSNGLLSHFNGKNWHNYSGNELPYFTGRYFSGAIKGNTIAVAGYKGGQAIITIGKR